MASLAHVFDHPSEVPRVMVPNRSNTDRVQVSLVRDILDQSQPIHQMGHCVFALQLDRATCPVLRGWFRFHGLQRRHHVMTSNSASDSHICPLPQLLKGSSWGANAVRILVT